MTSDSKIPEHGLTPQGRIYRRAASTNERLQEIAPDFRGSGATPQEKADTTKAWISQHRAGDREISSAKPGPDKYAQVVNERLGPVTSVMDTLHNGIEAAKERISGSSATQNASEAQNSAAAAFDKMDDVIPSLGSAVESKLDDTKSVEKGHANGVDGVLKALSDGASAQEDPLDANMRVTTEALS